MLAFFRGRGSFLWGKGADIPIGSTIIMLRRFGAGLAAVTLAGVLYAQTPPAKNEPAAPSGPGKESPDKLRRCVNEDTRSAQVPSDGRPIMSEVAMGNNPQEKQYREEIERLLTIEIENVKKAVQDVEQKHKRLIQLYPRLTNYNEIILEDVPGAWREGTFVNSKKVLSLTYAVGSDGAPKLTCLVMDSMTRNVYYPDQWTRKLMRLYYPNVQMVELETHRHNFQLPKPGQPSITLEGTSPEIQLRALRLIYLNLRTALYSMDMVIASYYDKRNRKNEWQINL
jgi:hypothetical protein